MMSTLAVKQSATEELGSKIKVVLSEDEDEKFRCDLLGWPDLLKS